MKKQTLLKVISLVLVIAALSAAVLPMQVHAQECAPGEHEYGGWYNYNSLQHERKCSICGAVQRENHDAEWIWTSFQTRETPYNASERYRDCPTCGTHISESHSADGIPAIIHFKTNGGSGVKDYEGIFCDAVFLDRYKPKKSGYVFEGWYTDEALTNKADDIFLLYDQNAIPVIGAFEVTLYAKYSASGNTGNGAVRDKIFFFPLPILPPNFNHSNLNFSTNGGAAIDPITLPTGTTVQLSQ
ncbi:MAG: InlB B-repeat-containing protein, partial [Clostridiales bacterium]|nr:InlB B-repeat-containing protein [Clostridiales bacterium]